MGKLGAENLDIEPSRRLWHAGCPDSSRPFRCPEPARPAQQPDLTFNSLASAARWLLRRVTHLSAVCCFGPHGAVPCGGYGAGEGSWTG